MTCPASRRNEWVADVIYYVNFVTPFVEAIRDPSSSALSPLGDVIYCIVAALLALALGVLVVAGAWTTRSRLSFDLTTLAAMEAGSIVARTSAAASASTLSVM